MKAIKEFEPGHVAYWADLDPQPALFGSPEEVAVGVEPAMALVTKATEEADFGMQVVRVAWKPTEEDLLNLAAGGTVWLSTWGGLPMHMLEVQPPWPTT